MDRLRRILVGIDFSTCSLNALKHGARIARWNGAELHLLHAEPPWAVGVGNQERLEELAHSIEDLQVQAHVASGPALEVFLDHFEQSPPDLLLLGAYGPLGSFVGTGIGAFTAQCLRHVPAKVLVVREREVAAFRRIVACIDFSPTSQVVFEQALRLASQEQGVLHLLHVVREGEDTSEPRRRLEALRSGVADQGSFTLEARLLEGEGYAKGVLDHAQAVAADLVVLGTRGHSDLEYVLMGTTAERVLRKVRCCTLVVKPPGFVSPREVYRR